MGTDIRKVIIIGSGPAGYTAAVYAARANLSPLVFAGPEPGGQLSLTTDVENYPGFPEGIKGPELMAAMKAQAERFGAEVVFEVVDKVDFSKRPFAVQTESGEHLAETIIISSGASAKMMGLESERRLLGKGVSTCATCDGYFYRGQEIIVVGGGDSAMEEATFLTKFASKVYVVHRRDKLRASKIMQDRAFKNEKIKFMWNSVITEIHADDKGLVNAVTLENVKTGGKQHMPIAGVFVAIGHKPNTSIFKGQIDLDELGYIKTRQRTQTNIPGVFAAGDVVDHYYRQAITAAGMGCQAAIDAERFLEAQG